jgi:hypothetical protein
MWFQAKEHPMQKSLLALAAIASAALLVAGLAPTAGVAADPAKAAAATSDKAPAKPAQPRKLLIFTLSKGWYTHESTAAGTDAFTAMGQRTGAFEATTSADLAALAAASLAKFDAVCLLNTQGDWLLDPDLRQGFLDYVKGGHGLVAIHAAADSNTTWPEYAELLGANFSGATNWNRASLKLDDPASPLNAAFEGKGFNYLGETYTFRAPYSRDKLHILFSMDWEASRLGGGNRPDNDFAFSWIHAYGQGRVFYCAFGHNPQDFSNAPLAQHFLAGIQYALGDLKADATPSAKLNIKPAPAPPFKP